eukprot:scaffold5868_cov120-Isochrysis_galbana.AAC.2
MPQATEASVAGASQVVPCAIHAGPESTPLNSVGSAACASKMTTMCVSGSSHAPGSASSMRASTSYPATPLSIASAVAPRKLLFVCVRGIASAWCANSLSPEASSALAGATAGGGLGGV